MKAKFLTVVLILSFGLFIGYAYASGVGPSEPYSSWCNAGYGEDVNSGDTYAYYSDSIGSAEARANGWEIGTHAGAIVSTAHPGADHWSDAWFDQQFKVIAAGGASITFSWDGWMEISPTYTPENGWGENQASVHFSLSVWDDLSGDSDGAGDTITLSSDSYSQNYLDSYTFTHYFSEDDIGKTFFVGGYLWTAVSSNIVDYDGDIGLDSDFYNSLKITDVSGGIAAVPIPGAIWLFGSGLIGLVVMRRRKLTL